MSEKPSLRHFDDFIAQVQAGQIRGAPETVLFGRYDLVSLPYREGDLREWLSEGVAGAAGGAVEAGASTGEASRGAAAG